MPKLTLLLTCSLFIFGCQKESHEPNDSDTDISDEALIYPTSAGFYNGNWESAYHSYWDHMDDGEPATIYSEYDSGVVRIELINTDLNKYRIVPIEGSPKESFREFTVDDTLAFNNEESWNSGDSFVYIEGHFFSENLSFKTFRGVNDSNDSFEGYEDETIIYSLILE